MAKKTLSRRDLLKLLALVPASIAVKPLLKVLPGASPDSPHIIILVFDAWSAHNVSLYGYPRQTMPNLEQFAQNATVYHRHYSTGTFTVPGTASLLTGLYPWTHRAIDLGGVIASPYPEDQIFAALSKTHDTIGYAQNVYADLYLYQAGRYLQTHIRNGSFNLNHSLIYSLPIFDKDAYIAFSSIEDNIIQRGIGQDGSLFFGPLYRVLSLRDKAIKEENVEGKYAAGLPNSLEDFLLNSPVTGAINILSELKSPSLVYLHFFPPHDPYRPTSHFGKFFLNGWQPMKKPIHPLALKKAPYSEILDRCVLYDQYITSWDDALAPLFEFFKTSGLLDKSYIFITADHGEMFERGEIGHSTPLLYEPLMHVPLIVSRPGQKQRIDIQTPTISVDVLPTLAHLTSNPIPGWAQGELLPVLGGQENPARSVYTMDAKTNASFAPLTKFSLSLTKANYRLTHYQYQGYSTFEFYDLADDPEEMQDLSASQPAAMQPMKDELLQKLDEVNRPFEK